MLVVFCWCLMEEAVSGYGFFLGDDEREIWIGVEKEADDGDGAKD